jgi:hypothetical protein
VLPGSRMKRDICGVLARRELEARLQDVGGFGSNMRDQRERERARQNTNEQVASLSYSNLYL